MGSRDPSTMPYTSRVDSACLLAPNALGTYGTDTAATWREAFDLGE